MEESKNKASKIISIITNIVFIPILVVSLVASILMFTAKQHNKVPSLFGLSSVVILTGSMVAGGFDQGDYVMVKHKNVSELVAKDDKNAGDIIAFYGYYNYKYSEDQIVDYSVKNINNENSTFDVSKYNEGQDEAASKKSPVIFHRISRIIKVKNKDGNFDPNDPTCYFFYTKGDSNGSEDTYAIRGDMVIGSYYEKGQWLSGIFKFCSSTLGILILVLVPTTLLMLSLGHSIIEQVADIKAENESNSEQYSNAGQIYQEKSLETSNKEKVKHKKIKEDKQTFTGQYAGLNSYSKKEEKPDIGQKEPKEKVEIKVAPKPVVPPKMPNKAPVPPKAPTPPKMPPPKMPPKK